MTQGNTILLLIGVFLFIVSLIINIAYDYREILRTGYLNHNNSINWIRKASCSLPAVLFLSFSTEAKWFWGLLFTGLMLMCWFWVIHSLSLNILRGYKWNYDGTQDEYDSATEKLARKIPSWLTVAIKITVTFITTYVYIKLL
jgi:hypothetical protein